MRDLIKQAIIVLSFTLLFSLLDKYVFANSYNVVTPEEVVQKNGLLTDNAKQNILSNTHFLHEVKSKYNEYNAMTFVIYDKVYFMLSNGNNIRRFSNNTSNTAYNGWYPYNNNTALMRGVDVYVFNLNGTYNTSTSNIMIGSATPDYVYTDIPINISNGFSMEARRIWRKLFI